MKRRIKKFLEAQISHQTKKELGLSKFTIPTSDSRYFYDEKKIEEVYDVHIFQITVYKLVNRNHLLIIPMKVEYKGSEYEIFMVLTSEDDVHYGSKTGEMGVSDLRSALGENWDYFDELTNQILYDHVPMDYWEVRGSLN